MSNSTKYTRGKNPNSHRNKPKVKAGEITVRLTQPALNYLAQFKNKTQVVEDLILAAAANKQNHPQSETFFADGSRDLKASLALLTKHGWSGTNSIQPIPQEFFDEAAKAADKYALQEWEEAQKNLTDAEINVSNEGTIETGEQEKSS
jgi:hypothetical protein